MPHRRCSGRVCSSWHLDVVTGAIARVLEKQCPPLGYQTLPDDIAQLVMRLTLVESHADSNMAEPAQRSPAPLDVIGAVRATSEWQPLGAAATP
jgi:hypothetical protein